MTQFTTKILVGQRAVEAVRTELEREAEAGERPPAPASANAGRTGHRTQERRGEADDDPPPSQRQLYDRLLTAINSGRFPYFATFRTPKPSPANGSPSYDPGAQEALGNEIARSLAAQGIAAIVCGSFQSINTQRQNPHFHALLSARPSYQWAKAFKAEFGRRAVHVKEIGPKPQDGPKVAYYIARQTVSVSVAHPRGFARSEKIDNAAEFSEPTEPEGEGEASAAPVALAHSPRPIPREARQRLVELGLLRPRPPP